MKNTWLLLAFSLLLTSCSKQNELAPLVTAQQEKIKIDVKELVWQSGFDTVNMRQFGDTILVNTDIALSEERLRFDYEMGTYPRQAVIYPQVILNDKDIKIYISPNFSLYDRIIIQSALNEFLSVNLNPYLGFNSITYVTNSNNADAKVLDYVANSSNECGYAAFPTLQKSLPLPLGIRWYIGEYMYINTSLFAILNDLQKKQLIAHEFGHQLGIRHTNWRGLGELKNDNYNGTTIGAFTVTGTNNTSNNPDPLSVFNGNSCGVSWTGFTQWDKMTIQAVIDNGFIGGIDPF